MGDIDLKKVAIAIILVIIVGFGIFFGVNAIDAANKEYEIEEISEKDYKYFAVYTDGKFGVVNDKGEVIIKNDYAEVTIPNPTKPVFICKSDSGKTESLNDKGEKIFTEFKNVTEIETNGVNSPWPYEKSVLRYEEDREIWTNKLRRKSYN